MTLHLRALRDSASFSEQLLKEFLGNGWGSLGKRDLDLLLFILLEKDGAWSRTASNYEVARLLRLTESRVALLRKDAYARWRLLNPEEPAAALARIFQTVLPQQKLEQVMKYATERKMSEGYIPLLIEHPDDRAEMERAIKVAGGVPIHERNREVILIRHSLLIDIADHHDLLQTDPGTIQSELKQIAQEVDILLAADTTLKEFLQMPIEKITPAAIRAAFNDAGATVAEHSLKSMPKLIRLWLPCLG
jgi:hypothetical protein